MKRTEFLLSTTSTLDGFKVVDYLGPVSAQFVIGTGIFADFFSAWTDFFGAHSRSYQKKLDKIDQEARTLIVEKAVRLGANAVIGLRVDHDEISGTGKSMLMVSGSGTAVRIARADESTHADYPGGQVSAYDLRSALSRENVLRKARAGELKWRDKGTWRFLVDQQVHEVAELLLDYVEDMLGRFSGPDEKAFVDSVFEEYFSSMPRDEVTSHLYGCCHRRWEVYEMAARTLRSMDGFDAGLIAEVINSDQPVAARRAISLAIIDKPTYEAADVTTLDQLRSVIEEFEAEVPLVPDKGMLGTKLVWHCVCGNKNGSAHQACGCGRGRDGFERGTHAPEQVAAALQNKIDMLRSLLGERATAQQAGGSHFA